MENKNIMNPQEFEALRKQAKGYKVKEEVSNKNGTTVDKPNMSFDELRKAARNFTAPQEDNDLPTIGELYDQRLAKAKELGLDKYNIGFGGRQIEIPETGALMRLRAHEDKEEEARKKKESELAPLINAVEGISGYTPYRGEGNPLFAIPKKPPIDASYIQASDESRRDGKYGTWYDAFYNEKTKIEEDYPHITVSNIEDYADKATRAVIGKMAKDKDGNVTTTTVMSNGKKAAYTQDEVYAVLYPKMAQTIVDGKMANDEEFKRAYIEKVAGMTYEEYLRQRADEAKERIKKIRKWAISSIEADYDRSNDKRKRNTIYLLSGGNNPLLIPAANEMTKAGVVEVVASPYDKMLEQIEAWEKNDFGSAFASSFDWKSFLTLGGIGKIEADKIEAVLEKARRGEILDSQEAYLFDALKAMEEITSMRDIIYEPQSGWASTGEALGNTANEVPGFMIANTLSGGVLTLAGWGAKANSAYKVAKAAKAARTAKGFGKVKAFGNYAYESGKLFAKNRASNFARDAVQAGIATGMSPSTYTRVQESWNEQYHINPDGTVTFTPKGTMELYATPIVNQWAEYYSEIWGAAFFDDIVKMSPYNLGSLLRFNRATKSGATATAALAPTKKKILADIARNAGWSGSLGAEITGEAYGDILSTAINSLYDENANFESFSDPNYWLTLLGVSAAMGGGISVLSAPSKMKMANYVHDLAKKREHVLSQISDKGLRERLTTLANGDPSLLVAELANTDWGSIEKPSDKAYAYDFANFNTQIQVALGYEMEGTRLARFDATRRDIERREYKKDGKGSGVIVTAVDSAGKGYYIIEGNSADQGSMLKCIEMETGKEVAKLASDLTITANDISLAVEIDNAYQEAFSVEVETERLLNEYDALKSLEDPTPEAVDNTMRSFGIVRPKQGDTVTLVDGRQAKVTEDVGNGIFIVESVDAEGNPMTESISFTKIESSDPITAIAQRQVEDFDVALDEIAKAQQETPAIENNQPLQPSEAAQTTEAPLQTPEVAQPREHKYKSGDVVMTASGQQARVVGYERGAVIVDYNLDEKASLDDKELDFVAENALSAIGETTAEATTPAMPTPSVPTAEASAPIEGSQSEEQVIERTKDGEIDYGKINNVDLLANLLIKNFGGLAKALKLVKKWIANTDKQIKKIEEKAENATSPNEEAEAQSKIRELTALKKKYEAAKAIIERRVAEEQQQKLKEVKAKKHDHTRHPEAGLVRDENTAPMDEGFLNLVDRMAKALGVKVSFTDKPLAHNAEGQYNGNEVTIDVKARTKTFSMLLGHEMMHHMREVSPEMYEAFKNAIKDYMGEEAFLMAVTARVASYQAQGVPIDNELAAEEICADEAGKMVDNEHVFYEFLESVDKKNSRAKRNKFLRGLLKVVDYISDKVSKMGVPEVDTKIKKRRNALLDLLNDVHEKQKNAPVMKAKSEETSAETTKSEETTAEEAKGEDNTGVKHALREMDAEYIEAVEKGDMETAQRMVMEAAKLAMPNTKVVDEDGNPKVVYHGTGSEFYTFRKTNDINELGAGYYFTDSYEMAERYATDESLSDNRFRAEALAFDIFTDEMGHSEEDYEDIEFEDDYNKAYDLAVERLFGNGHVKSVFLNIEKPRILSRGSSDFDPVYQYGFNLHKEGAMAQRYNDGIIDELFSERHEGLTGNQYVTFAPNQIKSADPVTYDDAGNVIPLSERFNPEKEDVRYSIRLPKEEYAKLSSEIMTRQHTYGKPAFDYAFTSDNYYVYDYLGNGESFINFAIPIVGNEEFIHDITKAIEDGTIDSATSLDTYVKEVRLGKRGDIAYNADALKKYKRYRGIHIRIPSREYNETGGLPEISGTDSRGLTSRGTNGNSNESGNQELDYHYSLRETDPEIIEQLNNGNTIKVYRAMQVIDGELYPPMSARVGGKLRAPIALGEWERAEERPDLADDKGYFKLDKGNSTSLKARYNPYIHTSLTPLNDQFSSAQDRPNLVTVEVEIPESELTSGYKADKAKDAVGKLEWKAGVVQGQLTGTRTVILSRWDRPIRIVPDSEVAQRIVEMFGDTKVIMPSNVVTPSLREELEKLGVPFRETDNQGKPKPQTLTTANGETKHSLPSLVGVHNISLDKLRKAIKMGGLANPSVAVIDVDKQTHDDYGDYTLVLPRNMVDARKGKNAGTWAGDAWTPTYPPIVKRMTDDKAISRFYKDIDALPEAMRNRVRLDFDSFMDGRDVGSLAYWYLNEKGVNPALVETPSRYSDEVINALSEATNGTFNLYNLTPEALAKCLEVYIKAEHNGDKAAYEAKIQERKERLMEKDETKVPDRVRKWAQEKVNELNEYGFDYGEVLNFVRDVESDVRKRGTVDVEATIRAAKDQIKAENLNADYDTWLESLDVRYGIKEYIFDGYTNSGDRKYLPHTVENASKWMKKQGREGAVATFPSFGVFIANAIPKMTTLESIRKRKALLGKSNEEFEAFKDKWLEVYHELGNKLQPDAKGFDDYGYWRLIEAVGKNNPKEFIKKEYGIDLTEEDMAKFNEMVDAIRTDYPARYFETKFERPLQLGDFVAAVVPNDMPNDVYGRLNDANVEIIEYDKDVEGSRKEAMQKASALEDVRFSLIGEKGAAMLDQADESMRRLEDLEAARQMERAGKKAKDIKRATGWERGADNLWRYEVDDYFEMFDSQGDINGEKKGDSGELQDYLDHEELYNAYPELRKIKVEVVEPSKIEGYNGLYYKDANKIVLARRAHEGMARTLFHEVQHAIQAIEGFAEGGNPDMTDPIKSNNILHRIEKLQKEVEAKEKARNDLMVQRDAVSDKMAAWFDAHEDVTKVSDWDDEMRSYDREYDKLRKQVATVQREIDKANNTIAALEKRDPKLGIDGYRRLAGEVEARSTAARVGMIWAERLESLASEMEDIAPKDQIFLKDGIAYATEAVEEATRYSLSEPSETSTTRYALPDIPFFEDEGDIVIFDEGAPESERIVYVAPMTTEERMHEMLESQHLARRKNIRKEAAQDIAFARSRYAEEYAKRMDRINNTRTFAGKLDMLFGDMPRETLPLRDQALALIAEDEVKIRWEDDGTKKGLASEMGYKEGEKKSYKQITSKATQSFEGFVHSWWESINGYERGIDTQDMRNALIEALSEASTQSRAFNILREVYDVARRERDAAIDDVQARRDYALQQEDARYAEERTRFDNAPDKAAYIRHYEMTRAMDENLDAMGELVSHLDATIASLKRKVNNVEAKRRAEREKRYTKMHEVYTSIEEAKTSIYDILKRMGAMRYNSNELKWIMNNVSKARSPKDIAIIADRVRNIALTIIIREQRNNMNKALNLRLPNGQMLESWLYGLQKKGIISAADAKRTMSDLWRGTNAKGVAVAKFVDDHTRQVMEKLRTEVMKNAKRHMEDSGKVDDDGNAVKTLSEDKELSMNVAGVRAAIEERINAFNQVEESAWSDSDKATYTMLNLYKKYLDVVENKQAVAHAREAMNENYTLSNEDGIEGKTARERMVELRAALVSAKTNYMKALMTLNEELQDTITKGREGYKSFLEREARHKHYILNLGLNAIGISNRKSVQKKTAKEIIALYGGRLLLNKPYWTFETVLREIDHLSPNGQGAFFHHFMDAADTAVGDYAARTVRHISTIGSKINDIWGYNNKDVASALLNVQKKANETIITTLTFKETTDNEGKVLPERVQQINIANGMYLLAMWAQDRYKRGMERRGITQEAMDALRAEIMASEDGAKYLKFMEWVRDTFLVDTREEYDIVYKKMFGTHMDAETNYFPAKILNYKREDDFDYKSGKVGELYVSGIIKRQSSAAFINPEVDYFAMLIDHVNKMDHWAAYAELHRDLKYLLNSEAFKERLKAYMGGIKSKDGKRDGEGSLYKLFWDASTVMLGMYNTDASTVEKIIMRMTKGWATANIAFRASTALKQFASSPLFAVYALDPRCQKEWLRAWATPKSAVKWALENSAAMRARIDRGDMGNEFLSRKGGGNDVLINEDGKVMAFLKSVDDVLSKGKKYGMMANVGVDALVSCIGLKAIYEFEVQRMTENGTKAMTDTIHKKALLAAERAVNETQQSSEGAYLSTIQKEKGIIATAITTYMNQPYAMHRKRLSGAQELVKQAFDKEYNEALSRMVEDITDPVERKKALRRIRKEARKVAYAEIAQGILGDFLFQLMGAGMGALAVACAGVDDDEIGLGMLKDALWGTLLSVSLGGFALGGLAISIASGFIDRFDKVPDNLVPALGGLFNELEKVRKDIKDKEYKTSLYESLNIISTYQFGVDGETLINMMRGVDGFIEGSGKTEGVMHILNMPKSQIRLIAGRRREGESVQEYVTRVARVETLGRNAIIDNLFDEYGKPIEKDRLDGVGGINDTRLKEIADKADVEWVKDVTDEFYDGGYEAYLRKEAEYQNAAQALGWTPDKNPNKKAIDDDGVYTAPLSSISLDEYAELSGMAKRVALEAKLRKEFIGSEAAYYDLLKAEIEAKQQFIDKYNEYKNTNE